MDEETILKKAVAEGRKALRDGVFSDTDYLLKTVEKMRAVAEEIPKLQKAVKRRRRDRTRRQSRSSSDSDSWTPSAEKATPQYKQDQAVFYGTSEVIATYSKASSALGAALKTLENVRLMAGLLDAETCNGVKNLKRTMGAMKVAGRIIDDAVSSGGGLDCFKRSLTAQEVGPLMMAEALKKRIPILVLPPHSSCKPSESTVVGGAIQASSQD
uniref:Senescence domain-containing protein n=1 Tax=Steinernema glaseri TaxID=37863 RepID=A0A1I7Y498_9BILA